MTFNARGGSTNRIAARNSSWKMRSSSMLRILLSTCLFAWSDLYSCEGRFVQVETYGNDHVIVSGLDVSQESATFSVKSCQDIRVSMQQSSTSISSTWEIVIGAGDNTYSDIYRGFYSSGVVRVQTPNIAHCSETRYFWLTWSSKGIMVGKGNVIRSDIFMFTNEYPSYKVAALSVASWNTFKGSYSFYNGPGDFGTLFTRDDLDFRSVLTYDLRGKDLFTFSVRACKDASIRLEPAGSSSTVYVVNIGTYGNTHTEITKGGQMVANTIGGEHLECRTFMPFWISWANGSIRIGKGKTIGVQLFVSYDDPKSVYPVGGISVYTAWGATGTWLFD